MLRDYVTQNDLNNVERLYYSKGEMYINVSLFSPGSQSRHGTCNIFISEPIAKSSQGEEGALCFGTPSDRDNIC